MNKNSFFFQKNWWYYFLDTVNEKSIVITFGALSNYCNLPQCFKSNIKLFFFVLNVVDTFSTTIVIAFFALKVYKQMKSKTFTFWQKEREKLLLSKYLENEKLKRAQSRKASKRKDTKIKQRKIKVITAVNKILLVPPKCKIILGTLWKCSFCYSP